MTIKDIARESGYAVGTVSRVLNHHPDVSEEARRQIMAVVERYHFRPNGNAHHLKKQVSDSIAVVVKGAGNLLFAGMVETIQSRVKAEGYSVIVSYLDEDDNEVEAAVQLLAERKPRGVLFLGGNRENFRTGFGEIQCPCVLVSTSADALEFPNLSSVSTNDTEAADNAIEYLVQNGHRQIGVIGGQSCVPDPPQGCNTSQLRLMGCMRACARHGIPFDPVRQTVQSRYSMRGGYEGAKALLDRCPEVTGIFAMCDVMAIGAMRAIQERGLKVPKDISVIGFDGIELGTYYTPQLTTVRQDRDRLAGRSVEILLGRMEKRVPAVYEVVPFQLVVGESVGNARQLP